MIKNKIITRLVMILLRRKLNLKNGEWFRFNNQKEDCCYCLTKHAVLKKYRRKKGYSLPVKSNVSVNWLLNYECKIIKEEV